MSNVLQSLQQGIKTAKSVKNWFSSLGNIHNSENPDFDNIGNDIGVKNFTLDFIQKFVVNEDEKSFIAPKQFFTVHISDHGSGNSVWDYDTSPYTEFKKDFTYLVTGISLPTYGLSGNPTYIKDSWAKAEGHDLVLEFLETEDSICDYFILNWIKALSSTSQRDFRFVNIYVDIWDSKFQEPILTYKFNKCLPDSIGDISLSHSFENKMSRTTTFTYQTVDITTGIKGSHYKMTEKQKLEKNMKDLSKRWMRVVNNVLD